MLVLAQSAVRHGLACQVERLYEPGRRRQAAREGGLILSSSTYLSPPLSFSHSEQVVLAGLTLADTLMAAGESLAETVVALKSTHGALVSDINILR